MGQLVLPLLGEASGADDEASLEVAARDQFLHEQAGHDGLAGPGSSAKRKRSGWRGGMAS